MSKIKENGKNKYLQYDGQNQNHFKRIHLIFFGTTWWRNYKNNNKKYIASAEGEMNYLEVLMYLHTKVLSSKGAISLINQLREVFISAF